MQSDRVGKARHVVRRPEGLRSRLAPGVRSVLTEAATRPRALALARGVLRGAVRADLLPRRLAATYARVELRVPCDPDGLLRAWEVTTLATERGEPTTIDPSVRLRLISAMRRCGTPPEQTSSQAVGVITASPRPAHDGSILLRELVDDGDVALARSIAASAGERLGTSERLLLEHALARLTEDDDGAERLEHELGTLPDPDNDVVERIRLERWIAFGHHREIAASWSAPEPRQRPSNVITARSLLALGDTRSAEKLLAGSTTNDLARVLAEIERLVLLGDIEGAVRLVREHLSFIIGNSRLLRAAVEVLRHAGDHEDREILTELASSTSWGRLDDPRAADRRIQRVG